MADQRVVLVTGGSHGIGAACAGRLAGEGWRVVIVDREVPAAGHVGRFIAGDVGVEADVVAAVADVRAVEGRLDGLVCNAGIMIRKTLGELRLAEWERVLATNLTSSFLFVRAAEDLLRRAGGGVVCVASTRAHQSEPDTESYAAAKGGLVALTHALAVSLGPDVRVNCVSPGWIDVRGEVLRAEDHAQHPAGRVGTPADVAAIVSWLLSSESGFVTGAEFVIDGGMTKRMLYV